jgi:hypothetical protein
VQSGLHLQRVQLPAYTVDHVENNLELRVSYLMKEIDEDTFKTRVQRANKQHEKKREIGDVIHLYLQTVTDIVHRLGDYAKTPLVEGKKIKAINTEERTEIKNRSNAILNEAEAIRDYANECLRDIGNTYGSKAKAIRIYDAADHHYRGPRDVLYTA